MIDIICATITSISAMICALMAMKAKRQEKLSEEEKVREEVRFQQRVEESRLQLAMINANSELTVGVATALKEGRCNGELEMGLLAVQEANLDYRAFLDSIALEHISK